MQPFSQLELRVIGCLIEKSITTPDQYPLSLNALTLACNQKSNRDPVLALSEQQVQATLDTLAEKRMVTRQSMAVSRVTKYAHRFCNTEFSDLQFCAQQLAILCVLFLRGPQTPGELRTRTNRLCEFKDVHETEAVLEQLCSNENPYLIKMLREPGKREFRYIHAFGDSPEMGQTPLVEDELTNSHPNKSMTSIEGRVDQLELQLALIQSELSELRQQINQPSAQ